MRTGQSFRFAFRFLTSSPWSGLQSELEPNRQHDSNFGSWWDAIQWYRPLKQHSDLSSLAPWTVLEAAPASRSVSTHTKLARPIRSTRPVSINQHHLVGDRQTVYTHARQDHRLESFSADREPGREGALVCEAPHPRPAPSHFCSITWSQTGLH